MKVDNKTNRVTVDVVKFLGLVRFGLGKHVDAQVSSDDGEHFNVRAALHPRGRGKKKK